MSESQAVAEPRSNAAAPSTTATTPASPVQTSAAPAVPSIEPNASGAPDWRAVLDAVDTRELAKHPKFSGLIGSHAERLAKQQVAQQVEVIKREADELALRKVEDQRLNYLRQNNVQAYVEEQDRVNQRRNQTQQQLAVEQTHSQAAWKEVDAVFDGLFFNAPQEVRDKLGGKNYNAATQGEARAMFVNDLLSELSAYNTKSASEKAVAEARSKWEKEELPVRIKEALGESVGSEPSPETGGGNVPSTGLITQEEFDKHRTSLEWRRANIQRISDGVKAGTIRR